MRRRPDPARLAARAALLLLAIPWLACANPGRSAPEAAAAAAPIPLRVMTFNVEYGGKGVDFARVIEAIELAAPDVVGLEEPEANTREIAAALGWPHADPRTDVISRFPILDPPGGDGRYVLVEVRPKEVVAVANVHLPSDPYGPYWIGEGRSLEDVLALERRVRLPKLQPMLDVVAGLAGTPVFLLGDFNAPSHLDWTGAAAEGRPHARDRVAWPVSVAVEQAGFVDSYRAVHPDPVEKPGLTWWAARPPVGDDFTGHPRDRIDLVYAAGPVETLASQIAGEAGARDVDLVVTPWPSDHRAVVSTFRVTPAPMPRLVAVGASRVNVGDPVEVRFHDPDGGGRRIALVAADAASTGSAGSGPGSAREVAPGRGSVQLPTRDLPPGPYEVVLLSAGDEVLARAPVRLKAPDDVTEVVVDRAVYAPGEAITVRWSNGPGHRWDWIGILPDAADAAAMASYPIWRHTGTRIDGDLTIGAGGSEDEPWPLPPGRYRALYLLNDTVSSVAQARFEVRGAQASEGAGVAVASAPYPPDSGSLRVRCGRLFDGIADGLRESVTVSIERGRIVAVGDDSALPAAPVLDLSDRTCLPGLIDMHTHLTDRPGDTTDLSVYYRRTLAEQVALGRDNARATLLAGFTSARDVGTYIAWSDRALRDEIARGETVGPRMQVAGFYLTIPGGGGDLVIPGIPEREIPAHVRTGVARGPEEFRRRAQLAVAGGADVLKLLASGAVLAFGGVPGSPEMTPEEIRAVVEVAHASGRRVAAHAHGAVSIKQAILAGADTIEHASLIDDEAIALAREHGVALSMDVYNGDYIETEGRRQGWPEEFLRKNLETTEAQREGFTRAHRAGVTIVYGTDSAVYPHGWNARQLEIMVARGMTPAEALRSATSLAADAMGWSDRVGSLQVGRYGDLIAVAGDPLADVGLLHHVDVVIKGGLPFALPAD
jgi:imidazolonepropionase-like amidohydrolase/endonuclease/exonuclease/phosphatase family metal-dependent hydrolase